MALECGLLRTWRLPFFSALLMLLKTSARTFMRTTEMQQEDGRKRKIYNLNKKASYILMLRAICFVYIVGKKAITKT